MCDRWGRERERGFFSPVVITYKMHGICDGVTMTCPTHDVILSGQQRREGINAMGMIVGMWILAVLFT